MLGKRIYKPLEEPYIYNTYGEKTKNNSESSSDKYSELAEWCNKNNAMIVDQGDYYEAVPVPEPTDEEVASRIRSQRDFKLSETDYLVVPDYPISPEDLALVKTYRQSLRDIPEQAGFPKSVVWPVEPQVLSAKNNK